MADEAKNKDWGNFWDRVIEDGKVPPVQEQACTAIQADALHHLARGYGGIDGGMLKRLRAKGLIDRYDRLTERGGEATILHGLELGHLPVEPLAMGTLFHVAVAAPGQGIARVEARRIVHRRAVAQGYAPDSERTPIYRDDHDGWWIGGNGEPVGCLARDAGAVHWVRQSEQVETLVDAHLRAFLSRQEAFEHLREALESMARSLSLSELADIPELPALAA